MTQAAQGDFVIKPEFDDNLAGIFFFCLRFYECFFYVEYVASGPRGRQWLRLKIHTISMIKTLLIIYIIFAL